LMSAPTATAAWLFAQHEDEQDSDIPRDDRTTFTALLDGLPVRLMASTQPHLETLQTIGCQDIGQLRRLPRGGLARRFGKEVLAELDRAFGIEPEVLAWYEPPATFCARLELPARVETTEPLLFAERRLLMQMTGWLVARHAAVTTFSLLLHHDTHRNRLTAVTPVKITMGSASRDLGHLTLLLQEHLAKIVLTTSVIELSLQADEIVQLAAPNTELFPNPVSQEESTGRLIERLASRLGDAAINRLSIAGDHRPERCSKLNSAVGATSTRKGRLGISGDAFTARPTWLLAQPLALMMRRERPFYQGALTLLVGPERIETGWWDDALAVRDYFIARNDGYLLLWIYRERQGANVIEAGWFLHGFFG
jgi:protein ImuB